MLNSVNAACNHIGRAIEALERIEAKLASRHLS